MRSRRERTSLKKNFLFTASPSSSILPKPCAATSCRTTAGSDGPRPPRAENGAGFDALHLLFHENPLKKNKKFFQHRTRAWAFFPFHESSAPAVPSCEMKRHECRHTLPALRQQGGKKGTDAFSHANPSVRGTAMLKSSTAAAERFLRHAGRTVRHDRLAAKSEKNIPAAAATDESGSSERQSAGDTSHPFDVPGADDRLPSVPYSPLGSHCGQPGVPAEETSHAGHRTAKDASWENPPNAPAEPATWCTDTLFPFTMRAFMIHKRA